MYGTYTSADIYLYLNLIKHVSFWKLHVRRSVGVSESDGPDSSDSFHWWLVIALVLFGRSGKRGWPALRKRRPMAGGARSVSMLSAPVPARSLSSSGVLKAENRTEARSWRCKKEKVNPTSLTWLWSVLIFVSLTEDRPHHRRDRV